VILWLDEVVSSDQGCHGELEFLQVRGIRELVGEGRGGVEELAVPNGSI
jgi:hypothetical protein